MQIWNEPVSTPLQLIRDEITEKAGIALYLKREDLIHLQVSGNKWRKLKYNLLEASKQGKHTLLTFGGAFSNHIYAVAAAGKISGFRTIGLIRGEEHMPLNHTLAFAIESGMQLHYISREQYRHKQEPAFLKGLQEKFGDYYLIPEGGSNAMAVKGCTEIIADIYISYDYLCCPCGTGGTLAGLIAGTTDTNQTIMGFSALKGGTFLTGEINELLTAYRQLEPHHTGTTASWFIQTDYHFGGYAKTTPVLLDFIRWFEHTHAIPLEQVYTGKMMFGLYDLMKKGYFKRGETIIAVHTGGLQGRMPALDAS
ncbi:1-aminocyclopropane-1-carboxylate deaminase/D-cysteine desulfhydrase [Rhodocytophaga rosea]|uniref:1-aminocyclopropane-1-carboxylate deaminase/D-cysteine desulfhydrase n=1 Tax=Rhodocytophaga rosea TaxID=2704465 RepID=A0A6C0GNU7_9BACT|nr:pyridoxal-phosphate dependent enzyme [Rhodocytophaga rosea]QHT69709.1 1-aminocyclopropane-1-carboxylate deaminase/D-cysteine desulfhydrase [Rhodocytophaga rosea]